MRFGISAVVDDVLLFLTVFEAAVVVELVLYPNSLYSTGSLAWYQAQAFHAALLFSPIVLLLLLYAWVTRLAYNPGSKDAVALDASNKATQDSKINESPTSNVKLTILSHPMLLLGIAMTLGVLLGLFPYYPGSNPDGTIIGVDTPTYITWTTQMISRPLSQAITYAFTQADAGFRPIPLLLLYSFASTGVGPQTAVKFAPAVLAPFLPLSSYTLVKSGLGDGRTAAVAALVSCFSFNLTVGIWAGYLANWLAIILANFFMAGLMAFANTGRKSFLASLVVTSLALQLTHPWTWILVLAGAFVFALNRPRGQRVILTLSASGLILTGAIVDVMRNAVIGSGTIVADLGTKGPVFGVTQLLSFWQNLGGGLMVLYDGLLGNTLLLALGTLPLLVLNYRSRMMGVLSSWVACASVPFAMLNSFHQTRLIYDLPIAPLVAIGVLLLISRAGGGQLRATLILLVVFLFSAAYALQGIIQA